jgi:hypothetical protein
MQALQADALDVQSSVEKPGTDSRTMSQRPAPNAEPGTGTQIAVVAAPPCGCRGEKDADECGDINHEYPNTYRHDGQRWKVGHDYLDTEVHDVVELVEVIRKSSWCDTGPAEEGTLYFVFEGERVGRCKVAPARRDIDMSERFLERIETQQPLGAPTPPW